jgi:hypothetical protein
MFNFKTKKQLLLRIKMLEAELNNVEFSHRMFANMTYEAWHNKLKPIHDHIDSLRKEYNKFPRQCLYCHAVRPVSVDDFNLLFSDFQSFVLKEIYPFWKKFSNVFSVFPYSNSYGYAVWKDPKQIELQLELFGHNEPNKFHHSKTRARD